MPSEEQPAAAGSPIGEEKQGALRVSGTPANAEGESRDEKARVDALVVGAGKLMFDAARVGAEAALANFVELMRQKGMGDVVAGVVTGWKGVEGGAGGDFPPKGKDGKVEMVGPCELRTADGLKLTPDQLSEEQIRNIQEQHRRFLDRTKYLGPDPGAPTGHRKGNALGRKRGRDTKI